MGWGRWERIIRRAERRAARTGLDPWGPELWPGELAIRYDMWADAHMARLRARRELHPRPGWTGWGPVPPPGWSAWDPEIDDPLPMGRFGSPPGR